MDVCPLRLPLCVRTEEAPPRGCGRRALGSHGPESVPLGCWCGKGALTLVLCVSQVLSREEPGREPTGGQHGHGGGQYPRL